MTLVRMASLFAIALLTTSCINHPIVKDYPSYLAEHVGDASFAPLSPKAGYVLTPRTRDHQLTFKWMATGAAHRWIVDFGKILELTLQSPDYAASFEPASDANALKITFDLVEYRFANAESQVQLQIEVVEGGETRLDKLYSANGPSQATKVRWSGVFAARNAITVSTKLAIDQILSELREDLRQQQIGESTTSTEVLR